MLPEGIVERAEMLFIYPSNRQLKKHFGAQLPPASSDAEFARSGVAAQATATAGGRTDAG